MEDKSIVLAVRVPREEGEMLSQIAEKEGRSLSELLREAYFFALIMHSGGEKINWSKDVVREAMGDDWDAIKQRVLDTYEALSDAKIAFEKLREELEITEGAMKEKAIKHLEEVGV